MGELGCGGGGWRGRESVEDDFGVGLGGAEEVGEEEDGVAGEVGGLGLKERRRERGRGEIAEATREGMVNETKGSEIYLSRSCFNLLGVEVDEEKQSRLTIRASTLQNASLRSVASLRELCSNDERGRRISSSFG